MAFSSRASMMASFWDMQPSSSCQPRLYQYVQALETSQLYKSNDVIAELLQHDVLWVRCPRKRLGPVIHGLGLVRSHGTSDSGRHSAFRLATVRETAG